MHSEGEEEDNQHSAYPGTQQHQPNITTEQLRAHPRVWTLTE